MKDDRRQYRTSVDYAGQISVDVVRPEDIQVTGQVVDLCIGGMGIFIDGESNPELAEGEVVYLHLTGKSLDEKLVTLGMIRRTSETEGGFTYAFEFVDWLGLLSKLPHDLKALFNQRGDFRVEISPEHPIVVEGVTTPSSDVAVLHDLSPYGLSFHVPLEAEGIFSPGHMVQVYFQLPDDQEMLKFDAKIRHCEWTGDRLYCGIFFEKDRTDNFQEKHEKVLQFVTESARGSRKLSPTQGSHSS